MEAIAMVDLKQQYLQLKTEIDAVVQQSLLEGDYVQGKQVKLFEKELANYTGIRNVISCGNGTDALQLALMALNLPKGSKIIVPTFTYIAPVEVATFLGYKVVFADVDITDFNTTLEHIQAVYTPEVKAIIIVHLFGLPCKDTELIYQFCQEKNIALIEDNAQSLGAEKNIDRESIHTTSFYPTKNLGAYGDGGAVFCRDENLAINIRKMATHGQSAKYMHDIVGINSRLDTLQAGILSVKLKYLDRQNEQRRKNAHYYQERLQHIEALELPTIHPNHIFHLYTIKIENKKRDMLIDFLKQKEITSIVNYPIPIYQQKAYQQDISLKNTERLCSEVLSIPIYAALTTAQLSYICDAIEEFFK
ncbi:MAG: hypothetical protein RJA25_219 [Bacteroidota bacterium]|jgi:dTDP-4-amino-4,6-dideoxygalactose transaminase